MRPGREESPLTKAQAHRLTARIVKAGEDLFALLVESWEKRAWAALKYRSWDEYARAEFGMTGRNAYLLLDQGRAVQAIEAACSGVKRASLPEAPEKAPVSARQAQVLKPDLPAAAAEVAEAVAAGANVPAAVKEAVAKRSPVTPARSLNHPAVKAAFAPSLDPECLPCRACNGTGVVRAPKRQGKVHPDTCPHPTIRRLGRECRDCGAFPGPSGLKL